MGYGRWVKRRVRPSDMLSKRTAQAIRRDTEVGGESIHSSPATPVSSPCSSSSSPASTSPVGWPAGLHPPVLAVEDVPQMGWGCGRVSRVWKAKGLPEPAIQHALSFSSLSSGFMPGCPRILFLEPSRLLVSWVWWKVSLRRLFCFHGSRSELSRVLSPSPDSVLAHSRLTATNFPGLRT